MCALFGSVFRLNEFGNWFFLFFLNFCKVYFLWPKLNVYSAADDKGFQWKCKEGDNFFIIQMPMSICGFLCTGYGSLFFDNEKRFFLKRKLMRVLRLTDKYLVLINFIKGKFGKYEP